MKDFPPFYRSATIIDIDDPDDKGRVKIKFLDDNTEPDRWLTVFDSFYSSGEHGWNGILGLGDNVRISFFDWPYCQKPVIDGKAKTTNNSLVRDEKETMFVKGHKVIFSDDGVKIEQKDGTTLNVEKDAVHLHATTKFNDIEIGGLKLLDFLSKLTTVGNLGLVCPVSPELILQIEAAILASTDVKIGVELI